MSDQSTPEVHESALRCHHLDGLPADVVFRVPVQTDVTETADIGCCNAHAREWLVRHPYSTVVWDRQRSPVAPTASARRTDPGTSHRAVDHMVHQLRGPQAKIARCAKELGMFTDTQLTAKLNERYPQPKPWVRNNVARMRLTVSERTGAIVNAGTLRNETVWRWHSGVSASGRVS